MIKDEYKTVFLPVDDEIIIKKSRFIGYIFPVISEEEAKEKIKQINKKNFEATHNCYAYSLLNGIKKSSDNGEPSGTAGTPILDVIEKNELFNVVIIITRYYGGILLGAGGLIRAYSAAAALAVKKSDIQIMTACTTIHISFNYNFYGKIRNFLNLIKNKIIYSDFGEIISIDIVIKSHEKTKFINDLIEITNGNIEFKEINEHFDNI